MINEEITKKGNPSCPTGAEGSLMLKRMNESHEEVTNWGLDFLKVKNPSSILDIGCGGGATLARLANRYTKAKIFGMDISDISIQESIEYNQDLMKKKRLLVGYGSVEDIPYEDSLFDAIVTVESFYFWPDPVENLKEVRRVLKTDGQFLLIADIHCYDGLSEHAKKNVKEFQMNNPSRDEFAEYMKRAGFSKWNIHTKEDWICVLCEK